jgi:hypothetical protein
MTNKIASVDTELSFGFHQIICLEYQNNLLYGEVIQSILERGRCWLRPICLAIVTENLSGNFLVDRSVEEIIDLRSSSDLILPNCLFRPAFDLEIIPLLAKLDETDDGSIVKKRSERYLNHFIELVWQANQDKFKT